MPKKFFLSSIIFAYSLGDDLLQSLIFQVWLSIVVCNGFINLFLRLAANQMFFVPLRDLYPVLDGRRERAEVKQWIEVEE